MAGWGVAGRDSNSAATIPQYHIPLLSFDLVSLPYLFGRVFCEVSRKDSSLQLIIQSETEAAGTKRWMWLGLGSFWQMRGWNELNDRCRVVLRLRFHVFWWYIRSALAWKSLEWSVLFCRVWLFNNGKSFGICRPRHMTLGTKTRHCFLFFWQMILPCLTTKLVSLVALKVKTGGSYNIPHPQALLCQPPTLSHHVWILRRPKVQSHHRYSWSVR